MTGEQENVGSGVVLEWPLGQRLPEQVATALMGPGAPFETTREVVNGFDYEVFVNRKRSLRKNSAHKAKNRRRRQGLKK